jgi:CRISPR system Cascade subunit CasD
MPNTIFLRLTGPMQSWGERAHWSVRDTAPEPTKSGIVGLLACALGVNSDDDLRILSQKIRVGVRCDKPGTRLLDYHTIGGGYKEPMLLMADGKPKYIPNTKLPHTEPTHRAYLCDAYFFVAIQSDCETITQLAEAVQNPVWVFFLGRKSCPPSEPIFVGTGDFIDLENALKKHLADDEPNLTVSSIRAVIECFSTDKDAVRRRDEFDSRSRRTYLPRYTRDILIDLMVGKEVS